MVQWTRRNLNVLLNAIPVGKKNQIVSDKIVERSGLGGGEKRTNWDLRVGIRILRKEGNLILSNTRGYWIVETVQEVREFIRRERQRVHGIEEMIHAIEDALKGWLKGWGEKR